MVENLQEKKNVPRLKKGTEKEFLFYRKFHFKIELFYGNEFS